MKEYRLAAWPQLRAPFDRIAHRRILSNMSHRYLSLAQMVDDSGLRRQDVRAFLEMLVTQGLVSQREATTVPDSLFGSLRPLGGWLRRAWSAPPAER